MPLAGHGLRPPPLRQRAGRPQLKRDPLGGYETMTALVVIRAFSVLASLSSVRPAPTYQTADTNRAPQEIARMESERREALLHHDTRALERLLAPEFTQIGNLTGERVITRAEALASNDSGTRRVQSWDASDVNIRMYGIVGLVTGLADVTDTLRGEARHIRFRYTHIWVKRNGRWQLVHRHTNRVATLQGPIPPD